MVSTLDGRVETGEGEVSTSSSPSPKPRPNWIGNVMLLVCVILMALILWYVITNVQALTTDPCRVCETKNALTTCMKIPLTGMGGN